MGFGFNGFFSNLIPNIVTIGFVVVLGVIMVRIMQGITQWSKNNNSPVDTRRARIISKRMEVSHHNHSTHDNMNHMSSSTTYYATFEFNGGERLELRLRGKEYGILAESDTGNLTFQGTRYLGFERDR